METLAGANGFGSVYDVIVPGQTLTIPGFGGGSIPASQPSTASRHEVMAGETLFSIAQQYGTSVAAIAGLNDILDENNIYIGSVLLIPSNGYGPSAPAPTGAAAAQSPSAWITYTVQLGDTLSGIAERYGVTLGSIVDANGIADPNNVPVGTVLDIPGVHGGNGGTTAVSSPSSSPGLVHVVEAGEGLYEIAEQYGVSAESIVEANGFESLDVAIHPGQVLAIPGGGTGVRWTNVQELSQAEYEQILDDAADEFGISRALIKAQAWIESGWQMSIVSHADAFGIMQIIPSTAEWAVLFLVPDAADWQTNARSNARLGVAIMHHWLLQSDWDVEVALASYYQGWDSLHEIGLYEDTKSYISAVLAFVPYFE
jgi:LysM repeat protein